MTTFDIIISGGYWAFDETSPDVSEIVVENSFSSMYPIASFVIANREHGLENIVPGDSVFIKINNRTVFDGYVDKIIYDWRGVQVYKFIAIGRTVDLYKVWTDEDGEYSGYTNEIAADLLADYLPEYAFIFRPSANVSSTGIYLESFRTKGRTVGKCLEDLARIDGYYYILSGSITNPTSGSLYWLQPSGTVASLTDSDIVGRRIKRIGNQKRINAIRVIGGYGVKSETQSWGTSSSPNPTRTFQVFERQGDGIRRMQLKLENWGTFSASGTISIVPVLYNIGPDMVIESSNLNNPAYVNDQNVSSYADVYLSATHNAWVTLAFKDDNDEYFSRYVHKIVIKWAANYSHYLGPVTVNDTSVVHQKEFVDGTDYYHVRTINIGLPVSSLRIDWFAGSNDTTLKVYEIWVFTHGFNPSRHLSYDSNYLFGDYQRDVTVPAGVTRTVTLDWNINLSRFNYWGILFERGGGNLGVHLHDDPINLNGVVFPEAYDVDGTLGPLNSGTEFDCGIEWLGQITFVSSQADSVQYKFPYEYYNENITSYKEAQQVAKTFLENYNNDFSGSITILGNPDYAIGKYVTLNVQSLNLHGDYLIRTVRHQIIPRKYYRTMLGLGHEGWSLEYIVSKIKSDLKSSKLE